MERQASSSVIGRYSPRKAANNFRRRQPRRQSSDEDFFPVRLSISTVGMGLERVNFDGEIFQRFGNGHRIGRGSF